jgi:hypothetical protein
LDPRADRFLWIVFSGHEPEPYMKLHRGGLGYRLDIVAHFIECLGVKR